MPDHNCMACGTSPIVYSRPRPVDLGYQRPDAIRLCQTCFTAWIETRFYRLVQNEQLIRPGEQVLVALSGGKDSQLLIALLNRFQQSLECDFVALTVDEGIAGYRELSLEIARSTTQRLGIRHVVISFANIYKLTLDEMVRRAEKAGRLTRNSPQVCTLCGIPRMRLVVEMATQLSCGVVATGRNLDDFVADCLVYMCTPFNATKLMGLRSLIHNPYKGIRIINPLCRFTDKEIALYSQLNQIPYQLEPECPYSRYMLSDLMRDQVYRIEEAVPGFRNSFASGMRCLQENMAPTLTKQPPRVCSRCGCANHSGAPGDICPSCEYIELVESLGGCVGNLSALYKSQ